MDEILRTSKRDEVHALMLVDIDDFKRANDTYGHEVGDWVLRDLTRNIRRILRKDDLIGRLGGDEFFAFLKTSRMQNWSPVKQGNYASIKCP